MTSPAHRAAAVRPCFPPGEQETCGEGWGQAAARCHGGAVDRCPCRGFFGSGVPCLEIYGRYTRTGRLLYQNIPSGTEAGTRTNSLPQQKQPMPVGMGDPRCGGAGLLFQLGHEPHGGISWETLGAVAFRERHSGTHFSLCSVYCWCSLYRVPLP